MHLVLVHVVLVHVHYSFILLAFRALCRASEVKHSGKCLDSLLRLGVLNLVQVLSQQSLQQQQQQLLSTQVGRGAHLGASYYSPAQGGYYQASQQPQPQAALASVFGSQSLTAFRNFHPSFKSLDLAAASAGGTLQQSPSEFSPAPQAKAMPPTAVTSGMTQQQQKTVFLGSQPTHFAAFGQPPPQQQQQQRQGTGQARGVPAPVHLLQMPAGVVAPRGSPHQQQLQQGPTAPKYPAPIQRPQQVPLQVPPQVSQAGLGALPQQQRSMPQVNSIRTGQPGPCQLPTSEQQAKQKAEAIKQAQLFFAQSKPSPACGSGSNSNNPLTLVEEGGKGPTPPPPPSSAPKDEDKKPLSAVAQEQSLNE